ncbi:MAG: phage baseplate protein [Candidatus Hodarchaeota archaeon]
MASARLFFSKRKSKLIGFVVVDAFVEEIHKKSSTVTKYPVENGADKSDHIRIEPLSLQITGVIGKASFLGSIGNKNEGLDAYNDLVYLQNLREPMTVITGLKVYENMVIENFTVPRTVKDGGSLVFNMNFTELQIVSSQTTTIPNQDIGGDETTVEQNQTVEDTGTNTTAQTQTVEDINIIEEVNAPAQEFLDNLFGVAQ